MVVVPRLLRPGSSTLYPAEPVQPLNAALKPGKDPAAFGIPNLENRSGGGLCSPRQPGTDLEAAEEQAELQEQWLAGR